MYLILIFYLMSCEVSVIVNTALIDKCDAGCYFPDKMKLQSTLVSLKSKGPSETLRDIRTSTYRMCKLRKIPIEKPNFTMNM